jgi:hypothetical protein
MMQRPSPTGRFSPALVAAAVCLVGCGPTAAPPRPPAADAHGDHGHGESHGHDHGHDHGDHKSPETFAAGVATLDSLVTDIAAKLAGGEADAADDAVHGVGHVLDDLQVLLGKSTLAYDARTAAAKAIDDLFECFDELDTAMHAAPGKADSPADVHARLKDRIEAAVKALQEVGR